MALSGHRDNRDGDGRPGIIRSRSAPASPRRRRNSAQEKPTEESSQREATMNDMTDLGIPTFDDVKPRMSASPVYSPHAGPDVDLFQRADRR
jgi:hypothetical protein